MGLYKIRIRIDNKLRKLFDDIYIQFACPWNNTNWSVNQSLSKSITLFEKKLATLQIEDFDYFISSFENYIKIFKEGSDVYDFVNNDKLRTTYIQLSVDDQETFGQNRSIALSIMEEFVKKMTTPSQFIFESYLVFKRNPSDFIELIVSLEENGAIRRKDGVKLTRKEIIKAFQYILNTDFSEKQLEKLLSAKVDNNNKTPFLKDLTKSFESYCKRKMDGRK